MAAHTRKLAIKFATFLYTNHHLQENDFVMEKEQARNLFFEVFKKKNDIRGPFSGVPYCLRSLNLIKKIKKTREGTLMHFNKTRLLKLMSSAAGGSRNVLSTTPVKRENIVPKKKANLAAGRNDNVSSNSTPSVKTRNTPKEKLKQEKLQFLIDGSPLLSNVILHKNVPKRMIFTIKNASAECLKVIEIGGKSPGIEFNPICPLILKPAQAVNNILQAHFVNDGIKRFPISVVIENKSSFNVELIFHIQDPFYDDLHPTEPYKKKSKPVFRELIEDKGERPDFWPSTPLLKSLKPYRMPEQLLMALNYNLQLLDGMSASVRAQIDEIKKVLDVKDKQKALQPNNYCKLLDLLLFIEEHQMCKDIREYDAADQVLVKANNLLELQVPGLAEHRPSVIIGNSILVREHSRSTSSFEGFVHAVKESSVLLKFSKNFMDSVFVSEKKFYVSFTFNRYPLKVEHQAVEFAKIDNIPHLLFPKIISVKPFTVPSLTWFNRDIQNNLEQQQAVGCILQKTSMPAPYLIYGPPGTGKTMTVVEAVKQIHHSTAAKILICTPSNSAANEVTRRLIDTIPGTDLFRYIAVSVPISQIPATIKPFTNFAGGCFTQPALKDFTKYRILVTTLVSAAKLVNSGCPPGHFSYVFIDESGQATETETLIPIARILTGSKSGVLDGQIVLAGDPRQLGPVIHSTLAKEYGFGISMLERLIDTCQPYQKNASNKYNPNALTKLLKNYRSHPALIAQPNKLFYDEEVQSAGDNFINAAVGWSELPNKKFPMIFHSVVGLDQREKNSPSFFNIREIQIVMSYLEKLIGSRMQGTLITEKQIAIISPYKKQVEKIKQACKKKKYDNLTICSTEQIQGQERLIVIITTVRSKLEMVNFDKKFHLGFLDNPKRFNVAITRAKALLILIGNPNILQYDKHWRSLITYCKDNKALVGEAFELREENLDQVLNDLQNLSMREDDDGPDGGASFARGNL